MGRLIETLGHKDYLDTNIIIYIIEGKDEFALLLDEFLDALNNSEITAVTSEITIAETLVIPFKNSDEHFQIIYKNFLTSTTNFEIVPISRKVLESAAEIRATKRLKLPDAVHWVTAGLYSCDSFLTNDRSFKNLSPDIVHLISDLNS